MTSLCLSEARHSRCDLLALVEHSMDLLKGLVAVVNTVEAVNDRGDVMSLGRGRHRFESVLSLVLDLHDFIIIRLVANLDVSLVLVSD